MERDGWLGGEEKSGLPENKCLADVASNLSTSRENFAPGGWFHAQVFPSKALMSGGGLESLQCIERRQTAQAIHIREKNSGKVEKRCFAGNRLFALLVYLVADACDERCRPLLGVDDDG